MPTEYENKIDEIKDISKQEVIDKASLKEKYDGLKKTKITEAKDILVKNNHKQDSIMRKIVEDLRGFVEKSYVSKILDAEFKRVYQKHAPAIAADGSTVTEGYESEDDNPKNMSAADITRNRINKLAEKAGGNVTRTINTSTGRSLPDKEDKEETTHEPEMTTVVLGPVHFTKVRDWINTDNKIYMDFNPDTMMVTNVYIKEDQ